MRIGVAEIIRTIRAVAAAAMTPPPAMPEAVVAVALIVAVLAEALIVVWRWIRLRLAAAGDERGQAAIVGGDVGLAAQIRLRRIDLRLRTMLLLLLIARRERLRVARQIRLRLRHRRLRREARLVLAHVRLTVVAIVVEVVVGGALRRALALLRLLIVVIGVLLAELLLRGGDQAEIMFGVLVVIFRRHRIARALRVARELDVFLRDVRGGAADFHVGPVRLVDPRQRILAFAVVVIVIVPACASDRFSSFAYSLTFHLRHAPPTVAEPQISPNEIHGAALARACHRAMF